MIILRNWIIHLYIHHIQFTNQYNNRYYCQHVATNVTANINSKDVLNIYPQKRSRANRLSILESIFWGWTIYIQWKQIPLCILSTLKLIHNGLHDLSEISLSKDWLSSYVDAIINSKDTLLNLIRYHHLKHSDYVVLNGDGILYGMVGFDEIW